MNLQPAISLGLRSAMLVCYSALSLAPSWFEVLPPNSSEATATALQKLNASIYEAKREENFDIVFELVQHTPFQD
jgi:hypothetical protein